MQDLFGNEKIMALSWNQPFASLMLHGKIETRKYKTNVRGRILICSCKEVYPNYKLFNISGPLHMLKINETLCDELTKELLGYAIAIGNLTDCRKMQLQDSMLTFTNFTENLWCWIFKDVRRIKPFEWKGKQGWKKLNENEKGKIEIL